MSKHIVPPVSFSRLDDTQKQDIHSVAERFLRDHLAKTGSKCETVRPVVARAACAVDSRSTAEGFLREHIAATQSEANRYEIEEPQHLILVRRSGNVTSYFYSWKEKQPVFTYAQHLAQQFEPTESDAQVRMLRLCNIEVTALPAPEVHRGSL